MTFSKIFLKKCRLGLDIYLQICLTRGWEGTSLSGHSKSDPLRQGVSSCSNRYISGDSGRGDRHPPQVQQTPQIISGLVLPAEAVEIIRPQIMEGNLALEDMVNSDEHRVATMAVRFFPRLIAIFGRVCQSIQLMDTPVQVAECSRGTKPAVPAAAA